MKVAFDISQIGSAKAGCGFFASSTAEALVGRTDVDLVFLRTFGTHWWDPDNARLTVAGAEKANYVAAFDDQGEAAAFWRSPIDEIVAAIGQPDIIHANNFFSPSRSRRARQVYTLYDMVVFDAPQFTTDANRNACVRQTLHAVANADAFVAISEFTKANFLDYFDVDPDRVTVVPLGSRFTVAGTEQTPPGLSASDPFLLTVGTIEPRKNHDGLLQALRRAAIDRDLHLVIVGQTGWHMSALPQTVAALGLSDRVTILPYVSDAELAWLYGHATAFLYPSHWEGFGLPIIEAMSRGCPVICSGTSSMREIAEAAAILVDPDDPAGLAAAIIRVSDDAMLRSGMIERGRATALRYDWSRCAAMLTEVYAHVLEAKPAQPRSTKGRWQRWMTEGRT